MMPFWLSQGYLSPLQWVWRAAVMFLWLLLAAKLMGQRQIGRLTLFDFAVAVTIGTVAGGPLSSAQASFSGGLISVATLCALDIAAAHLSLRSGRLGRVLQGEPHVLVKDGRLLPGSMRRTRLNLVDLLAELRLRNIPSLADVEFAILEPNGKVSVIPKSQARTLTPADLGLATAYEGLPAVLIEDGDIKRDNLRENMLDEQWLRTQLQAQGVADVRDVAAAMLDTKGRFYVSRK